MQNDRRINLGLTQQKSRDNNVMHTETRPGGGDRGRYPDIG